MARKWSKMSIAALGCSILSAWSSPLLAKDKSACIDIEKGDQLALYDRLSSEPCDTDNPIIDDRSLPSGSTVDAYFTAMRKRSGGPWTNVLVVQGQVSRGASYLTGTDGRGNPRPSSLRLLVDDHVFSLPVNNSEARLLDCPAARLGHVTAAVCVYGFFSAFSLPADAQTALQTTAAKRIRFRVTMQSGDEFDAEIPTSEWQKLVAARNSM